MNSLTDLKTILAEMKPALYSLPYVFCSVSIESYQKLSFQPLCTFYEEEGVSIIITEHQALDNKLEFDSTWARITLTVNSSLLAVGFLAAITKVLAESDISVNPIAAFYHDHLFVPWEKRDLVMKKLFELSSLHQ